MVLTADRTGSDSNPELIQGIEDKYTGNIRMTDDEFNHLQKLVRETYIPIGDDKIIWKMKDREETSIIKGKKIDEHHYQIKIDKHVGRIKLPLESPVVFNISSKFIDLDIWKMINFIIRNNIRVNLEDWIDTEYQEDTVQVVIKLFIERMFEFWSDLKKYGYQESADNLAGIRGRMNPLKTAGNLIMLKPFAYCHYEEFTLDQPFNQVLKYALESGLLLLRFADLASGQKLKEVEKLRMRIFRLLDEMSEVTSRPFTIDEIYQFDYDYLNLDYRELHRLALLIIGNGFASAEQGNYSTFSYLINTWALFENYIETVFDCYLPDYGCDFDIQTSYYWDDGVSHDRPDFIVKAKDWWVIIDAKFKKPDSRNVGTVTKDDYQQMAHYAGNFISRKYKKMKKAWQKERKPINEALPDRISFFLVYPTMREADTFRRENRGFFYIIHAPIVVDRNHINNEEYLKRFVGMIVKLSNIDSELCAINRQLEGFKQNSDYYERLIEDSTISYLEKSIKRLEEELKKNMAPC
ncbi:MAG: hypothetical protein ACFFD4_27990 [Candidatus Odinarchaeota archaeon]